jgi:hypothetical protein
MSDQSVEGRLLRGLLEVIARTDLTPSEAKAAAKALRSGKIFESAAHVLDALASLGSPDKSARNLSPPAPPEKKNGAPNGLPSVDRFFDTVKRRKVTKSQLYEIFNQVNPDAAPHIDEELSVRDSLKVFRSLATDDDWRLLKDIVEGRAEIDPFLRGILNR